MNDKYKISTVRDLTTGYDNSQPNNEAILPVSKSSQMITFNFDNGLVCTLRTSGTEPKIKYYTELCASPEQTLVDFWYFSGVVRVKLTLRHWNNAIVYLAYCKNFNYSTEIGKFCETRWTKWCKVLSMSSYSQKQMV